MPASMYSPPSDRTVWGYKDITFTGAAGAGAIGTVTYLTASGDVALTFYSEICKTSLVGAATYEVGITGDTNSIVAQQANATTIDAGFVYDIDTGAFRVAGGQLSGVGGYPYMTVEDGSTIIATIGAANITAGVMRIYYAYIPLSPGASLS